MASRICPNCGQEAPSTARFCPQCATSFVGDPVQPGAPTVNYSYTKKKPNIGVIAAIAGAGVLLVTAMVVAGTSLMRANQAVQPPATPLIQAPAANVTAPPLVQAPNTPLPSAPPVTQANNVQPAGPPQAIVNYLAFVQQMEQQRTALEADQTAAILPLLGTAQGLKTDTDDDDTSRQNGMSQINQGMTQNLQKWQALIKQFQATTPPAGCEDLGNQYYKLLQDYTDLSSQIQVALASGDIAKVMSLQTAQGTVDTDANLADSAVTSVCSKYGAKKLFVITTGSGGSGTSLMGG